MKSPHPYSSPFRAVLKFLQNIGAKLLGGNLGEGPRTVIGTGTRGEPYEQFGDVEKSTQKLGEVHPGFAVVLGWGYTLQERYGSYSLSTRTRRWHLFQSEGQWFAFHTEDHLGYSYYHGPVNGEPFGVYTCRSHHGVGAPKTLDVTRSYYNASSSVSSSSKSSSSASYDTEPSGDSPNTVSSSSGSVSDTSSSS